mgnify:CR=1 FL=1
MNAMSVADETWMSYVRMPVEAGAMATRREVSVKATPTAPVWEWEAEARTDAVEERALRELVAECSRRKKLTRGWYTN